MSGNAPAGGFDFQSDAFAFVAAHALAAQPIDWFDGLISVPVAISMETGGPGDDLRVELSDGCCIEIQTKKGLNRGEEFDDAVSKLARGLITNPNLFGILLVDTAASAPIRETLRQDFLRIADGRDDLLKPETLDLLAMLDALGIRERKLFQRFRIVVKDFAPTGDGRAAAISLLRTVVADPLRAADAWGILSDEGLSLCTRRGRRDIEALGQLLRLRPDAEARVLAKHHYRKWVEITNADFFVPALNLRLPVDEAWNQLHWLVARGPSGDSEQPSLARELKRYHEWARLADAFPSERGPVADFLREEQHLIIIGGPGSGKSTLLRLIAHDAAITGKNVLRISLQLVRQFMAVGRSFEEAVAAAASQGSPLDPKTIQGFLASIDLLLADGLDETEPQRLSVVGALTDWALAHPQTQVCVTTRPIGHQPGLLRTFREAEILPLSRDESGDLAARLLRAYGHSAERAGELAKPFHRQEDRDEKHKASTIAMRNPLLLTFLVRRHIDGQPLSGRRAALYSRILELIRRTPVTDRAAPDDPGAVVARTGLAALAWKLQSTPGCPRMDALAFVTEELSKASGNSSINSAQLSEAIERFWETRRLLERVQVGSEETITFVHLSLAEFAAAEHLRAMSDAALPKWLADHRRESSWSDTIALACGAGALERIVPLLLAHDDPADPCSAEAILSASALAEAEQPPAELATKVARHLAIRLDSAIPLVSIEAAERLTSLAPIMSDFVEQVCCPRLNHTQNWTRLGAHAALLGTGSNALMAAQATAWLSDQTQVAAISFLRGGLRIDETDAEIPAAGRTLRRKALTRAFEVIFRQLPRDEARSMADQFLSHPGITAAELAEVGFVLAEHDSRDLTARFFSVGGPMPEFGDLKSRGKLATTEFLRLLLDAIGTREVPKRDDSQRRLSNLFIVLDAVDWWRQPLYAIYAFARKEEPDSAVEVLRAVSSVLDVSREGLAAEINHLLTLDDPNPAMFRAADITKRGMEVHWSRGADLAVDPVKLVRGFVHPSDLIQLAAAQLVYAGTGGPVAAAELKSLLPRVINRALLGVAIVGAKVWGNDAQSLLIARFNAEPSEGTEHICKVLADGTCPTKSEEVTALLIGALKHERSSVAYAAAEGIRKLNLDATPQYRARLLGTFTHWQGTDIFCDRCRVVCPYGACPQCHISQKTPIEPLVHELTRAHCLNDTELSSLAQSRWHEVKEAAIIELAEIVRTEEAVLTKFVEQWNREDSLTAVLDKLLLVPKVRLIPIVESLLPLRRSASSKVRVRMVAALPALPCDPQRLADFAQEALTDEAPAVRNAAARSLRMLRMPSAVRDEEDDL